MGKPGTEANGGSVYTRLFSFGVFFGIGCLVPLVILIYSQFRTLSANITTVEEMAWSRAHPNYGWAPDRNSDPVMWRVYAPYDRGSRLANLAAFVSGRR